MGKKSYAFPLIVVEPVYTVAKVRYWLLRIVSCVYSAYGVASDNVVWMCLM